jgi:F0F1-type ATP synthase epsilon subunit
MADEPIKNAPKEEQKDDKKKKKKQKELDSTTVQVKVYSPFKTYFSGPATSVSAENATGPFDILPQHHNFMSILNPGDIVVRTEEGEHKYRIARGIIHVKENEIIIFLDV